MRLSTCILLASLSSASPSAWPLNDVAPGQWEITTKVELPKLPFGLAVPENLPLPRSGTRTFCVAPEDIDRPDAAVKAQTGCRLQELREADGHFDWRVSCDGPPQTRSRGRTTVNGDSLEGTATVVTVVQGFELPVSLRYSGRRLGACSP